MVIPSIPPPIPIEAAAPGLAPPHGHPPSTAAPRSGLSRPPTMVGVSSRAFYILILAALMKAASMLTSLGSKSIRIMSIFRGSVFHLSSNPLVRFFLPFVKLWHCQKTWSGVSSDAPHVQVPCVPDCAPGLCGHFGGDRFKSPLFCSLCLYQGTTCKADSLTAICEPIV
jgi:hypothetical protein